MESATELQVHRSVSVPLTRARAFALFTERTVEFWPKDHSIGDAAIEAVVIEPESGGRWYERGTDGVECDWGRVGQWQPPEKVVLVWQLGANFVFDPDLATEVEVTFTEEGADRTRVDLRHRHLERYGDQADAMYAMFDSPGGWTGTLAAFAEEAAR